jgi:hypothetical protein
MDSGSKRDFPFVIGGFNLEVQRRNPEGCEKVAGGRSEAKTTGWGQARRSHPDGVPDEKRIQDSLLAPLRGATLF